MEAAGPIEEDIFVRTSSINGDDDGSDGVLFSLTTKLNDEKHQWRKRDFIPGVLC